MCEYVWAQGELADLRDVSAGEGRSVVSVAPQIATWCCAPLFDSNDATSRPAGTQHRYTVEIAALESERSKLRSKVDMFQRQV